MQDVWTSMKDTAIKLAKYRYPELCYTFWIPVVKNVVNNKPLQHQINS